MREQGAASVVISMVSTSGGGALKPALGKTGNKLTHSGCFVSADRSQKPKSLSQLRAMHLRDQGSNQTRPISPFENGNRRSGREMAP